MPVFETLSTEIENIKSFNLTSLDLKPFVAALLSVLFFLSILEFFLLPRFMDLVPIEYSNAHIYTKPSYAVDDVKKTKKQGWLIAFVGGSAVREAFFESDDVEAKLKEKVESIDFIKLGSPSQNLLESYELITNLPIDEKTIIYLAVNPNRLAHDANDLLKKYCQAKMPFLDDKNVRVFLENQNLEPECFSKISRHASYLFYYIDWRLQHGHSPFFESLQPPADNIYKDREPFTDKQRINLIEKQKRQHLINFEEAQPITLTLVKQIHSYVSEKGGQLILVDLPQHNIGKKSLEGIESNYKQTISALDDMGVTYKDLNSKSKMLGFTDSDFYDVTHFTDSGREKFWYHFLKMLEENMGTKGLIE